MKKRLWPEANAMLELPAASTLERRSTSRRTVKRSATQGKAANERASEWTDRDGEAGRRQIRIDAASAADDATVNEPVIRAHRVVFAMGPAGSLQVVVF